MRGRALGLAIWVLLGLAGFDGALNAQPLPEAAGGVPFAKFVEGVWPEAQKAGVSRGVFDKAFKGVGPEMGLPDLLLPGRKPIDVVGQEAFVTPPHVYLERGALRRLTEGGKLFMAKHLKWVERIEQELGIDRAIVMGIWGRETGYGGKKPPYYAIRVLATQAWIGRRKDMFRAELIAGLRMLQEGAVTVEGMRSSWAGAQGLPQLMPSAFLVHAYDLDKDGKKDIWNSVPDALASAAHQLKARGWRKGLPWGLEVTLPAGVDCSVEGLEDEKALADWGKLGMRLAGGGALPEALAGEAAYLMAPAGAHGPAFLVTHNFKVLRAYNTSDLYGVFVAHLGDRIAGGGDLVTAWRGTAQLTAGEIQETQERLKAQGFAIGGVDGKIGSNTRRQVGLFQRKAGMGVDCWPGAETLARLRAPQGAVAR